MTEIIQLISGPRNISTAMMYSFGNRKDTAIVDEPFYAYYLSHFGVDHPGRHEIIASMSADPEEVKRKVLFKNRPEKYLFVKNMAHHMDGYDYSYSCDIRNIFLIRDPRKLITSFAKVIHHPAVRDLGIKQEVELYKEISKNCRFNPIVVDSGELLKDPCAVISELCRRLDIPFSEKMLKWKAGPRKEDGVWEKYWYHSVHKTTEFTPQKSEHPHLPDRLWGLYEEVKPDYEYLFEKAIKA